MAQLDTNIKQEEKVLDQYELQKMNIVIIGHVDHGKSTLVGRLLADTNSLPEGKLQEVQQRCKQNSRPFEYAFLLDALKDEQAQGITIDSARCFFRSDKREYILIDAPGHIEFLKNMISGAARAEAAVLVIDAHEGVQENSRRHGYLLSMLGINQVAVVVNKMDLADYSQERFENVKKEYTEFLERINVKARFFIPISAREGDNISQASDQMKWYSGPTVLESLDNFDKEASRIDKPLRLPVQDIYKFTEKNDDRRIVSGRIETGELNVGDEVVFYPSRKRTTVATIEGFNVPVQTNAFAGQSTGFTITKQIYAQPGELVCRADQPEPHVSKQLKVNLFWLGKEPMIFDKRYLLKLANTRVPVWLRRINNVLDASELTTENNRDHIERHDVAECILETVKPVAFDLTNEIAQTGRFVIIDNYQIAGGGVILDSESQHEDLIDEHVRLRDKAWRRSSITPSVRGLRHGQRPTLVLINGAIDTGKAVIAKKLEEKLFSEGRQVYYLGVDNSILGLDQLGSGSLRDDYIKRLGETAHLFTDAGFVFIATVSNLEQYELNILRKLTTPGDVLVVGVDDYILSDDNIDLSIASKDDYNVSIDNIINLLTRKQYLPDYII